MTNDDKLEREYFETAFDDMFKEEIGKAPKSESVKPAPAEPVTENQGGFDLDWDPEVVNNILDLDDKTGQKMVSHDSGLSGGLSASKSRYQSHSEGKIEPYDNSRTSEYQDLYAYNKF